MYFIQICIPLGRIKRKTFLKYRILVISFCGRRGMSLRGKSGITWVFLVRSGEHFLMRIAALGSCSNTHLRYRLRPEACCAPALPEAAPCLCCLLAELWGRAAIEWSSGGAGAALSSAFCRRPPGGRPPLVLGLRASFSLCLSSCRFKFLHFPKPVEMVPKMSLMSKQPKAKQNRKSGKLYVSM